MARKARYTKSLPVYVVEDVRERIQKLADDHDVSQAEVVRDIIDCGIDEAETRWAAL